MQDTTSAFVSRAVVDLLMVDAGWVEQWIIVVACLPLVCAGACDIQVQLQDTVWPAAVAGR
jgi:hypothetical protein